MSTDRASELALAGADQDNRAAIREVNDPVARPAQRPEHPRVLAPIQDYCLDVLSIEQC